MGATEDAAAVIVYSHGLAFCSACAPAEMGLSRVEAAVNLRYPTGIGTHWHGSPDRQFADGSPQPGPCNTDPARRHFLLQC